MNIVKKSMELGCRCGRPITTSGFSKTGLPPLTSLRFVHFTTTINGSGSLLGTVCLALSRCSWTSASAPASDQSPRLIMKVFDVVASLPLERTR